MLKIPRQLDAFVRRQDKPTSEGNGDGGSSTKTSTSASPTRTSNKNSATPTDNGASHEEGSLAADKPQTESPSATKGSNNNHSDDNNGNNNNDNSEDVKTDAAGNPVITDANASHWSLIMPTGVSYLSGAPHQVARAASLGILGAVVAAAAMF
ncbi:hypothetical protein LPJ61_001151 [Coemansia biformis]|uniref:Uncharacterized protein n=1 Tax=Coemansia biformis TaxID=1286918 RepID=A0A9W7YHA5_9FUNG|nr:hypothetical protein LPJ61_001151 [Coemansia biformis]